MGKNDGGPAYPVDRGNPRDPQGMSLRDWFAGQALAGFLASLPKEMATMGMDYDRYGKCCYILADVMIAEREKDE